MNARHDPPPAIDDPYLDLDLDGVRLIEASAGTGKTFTLATLALRLVVERDLRLARVLVVTYTEAATQELRARLRKRLQLAARIADELAEGRDPADADTPEAASTRWLLQRRLHDEDAQALRARLRRAAAEIDLAAVFTIHGFCTRVLAEHALQTGQAFEAAELIGSERELHDELADDLWRLHGADPGEAELLTALWPEPDALARDLDALLRTPQLLPPPPPAAPDPIDAVRGAADSLRGAFRAHGDDARAQLDAAVANKVLNGNSYRPALVAALWQALRRWSNGDDIGGIEPRLDRLTPDLLALRTNKGRHADTPRSPLFDAAARYLDAQRARAAWLRDASLGFLHRLRDDARVRLAERKRTLRVRSYDDLIDGVAAALDGDAGPALAAALRAQYAVALVDEFQDTDARQWSIFGRVFGDGVAAELFLIGDPKQAIYGFRGGDVDAYLAARDIAVPAPALTRNFRSRPGLLRALDALYARAGEHAFVDARIRFQTVVPGRADDDADAGPALTVRLLPAPADGAARLADDSRATAAAACAIAIHGVLRDARAGHAASNGAPVRPADIAVLVRDYKEAAHIQTALAAVGVATVAAGRRSLFQTEQAQDVLAVLEALLQPADDARLRAALATVFLGRDAADIARMDEDDAWRGAEHLAAVTWRERWQRHGPLALLSDLCAEHAERLLARADGERRLTNLLQLGELLQQAAAAALGLAGLVDWLRRRIVEADPNDEAQLLRLESDAQRVQILTLHGSKGLEFPRVYLPFAGIGRGETTPPRHCTVSQDGRRVLHWKVDGDPRWDDAVARWKDERRAEDARLLYVGLTRARQAVWLAWSAFHRADATALKALLDDPLALPAHADIRIDAAPLGERPAPLSPLAVADVPAARRAVRVLSRDWWVHSFTQLTGEAARIADADRGADDEPDALPGFDGLAFEGADGGGVDPNLDAAFDRRFAGSRFGNVLHDALERVDFNAWRAPDPDAELAPAQQAALLDALRHGGYADADLAPGLASLAALVGRTLGAPLPEGVRLCDLPPDARRAEMEFHFALGSVPVDALLALLHAHGWLRERHGFGARRRLEGLMTGKIDLVYTHAGRYYLLDYKSNRLPAYDPDAIVRAMDDSEYTLQALIYTLALHRWLRFRLGADYDYARDFGGVRYLFCRGLDPALPAQGVYAQVPPPALVAALDALFATQGDGGAR